MKKVFFTLILLTTISLASQAQVYIQGGLNLANITKNNEGQTEDNNTLPSFNAGILGRLNVAPMFALESGLLLTGHGSKAETVLNNGNYTKAKFNPFYIQVPLNAVAKIPLGAKNTNVFFHAGPYAAIGIGGKSKRETRVFGGVIVNEESNIEFNDDDPSTSQQENARYDRLKRFDFGLNFGGGIQVQHIMFKVNYGLGLAKINSTDNNNNDNDKNKYRTLSFSVGIPLSL